MEDFEIKTVNKAEHPPRVWKRYVDDTLVVKESSGKDRFLEQINSMDPYTTFTVEEARADGSLPFFDTLVMPEPDNSLTTSV